MINLFDIPQYRVDTKKLGNWLSGPIVGEFEKNFADYVGAKYCCSLSSASVAIELLFYQLDLEITIPSIIPPVVPNHILHDNNKIKFVDNVDWVGHSYLLHTFPDGAKIVDSAQEVTKDQFKAYSDKDVIIYSFYPTKPIGSCDGGCIVSNDSKVMELIRIASNNGMSKAENNWEKTVDFYGWKMYMNSIQAYIANKNLMCLDKKKEKLAEIREYYNKSFETNNTSDHLFRIRVKDNTKFIQKMQEVGIICGIHYKPCHRMEAYANYAKNIDLPNSDIDGKTMVSIPFHINLTEDNLNYIIEKTHEFREVE